jgi:SAM-dependent methyltransferase
MTQEDIRRHYEVEWKQQSDAAEASSDMPYCSPLDDAVVLPAYRRLLADANLAVRGGRVLDVGAGSGRWVRFLIDHYGPRRVVAIDFARSSIDLLQRWLRPAPSTELECRQMDVTAERFDLTERFDLINAQNVLYHIPEPDLHRRALRNLASVLDRSGAIVINEYMPRASMRTEWMLARSRYEVEHAVKEAGLRIAAMVPCKFFDGSSMGVDGPEGAVRSRLQAVWSRMDGLLKADLDPEAKRFFLSLFAELDGAVGDFCRERMAAVEFPAGKFLVLRPAG